MLDAGTVHPNSLCRNEKTPPHRGPRRRAAREAWRPISAAVFEEHLDEIRKIIAAVGRRLHLSPVDTEDFASTVILHLIDDDFRVLKRFRGDCNWSAFLHRVVLNRGRDYLNHRLGKWRPSQAARNIGLDAERLEILRVRDEHTFDESVARLRSEGTRRTIAELIEIDRQLPCRPRRRFQNDSVLRTLQSGANADQRIAVAEARAERSETSAALTRALERLRRQEREILHLHYSQGQSFAKISRALGMPQRKVYSVHYRCLRRLRRSLEDQGFQRLDVLPNIGSH